MSANSRSNAVRNSFEQRGGIAMQRARMSIIQSVEEDNHLSSAVMYFSKVTLHNALPVFPALITMSCQALGGDIEKVTPFGEAIVLISAAADLHDDVLDQSLVKGQKQTVLGKFGVGTTVLAGDLLLVEGLKKLSEACQVLPKAKSSLIMTAVTKAIGEICSAEALEIRLRSKPDLTPTEYQEVIRLKAVVPELAMRIGAILANGSTKDIEKLSRFGRAYGTVSIIVEEFADLLSIEELSNRIKNECPPLPLIYALQNPKIKENLFPLLKNINGKGVHEKVVDTVFDSNELIELQTLIISDITLDLEKLPIKIKGKIREELKELLLVPLKYFKES
jgi:geranylgeranyl pyrophosphate synthase